MATMTIYGLLRRLITGNFALDERDASLALVDELESMNVFGTVAGAMNPRVIHEFEPTRYGPNCNVCGSVREDH